MRPRRPFLLGVTATATFALTAVPATADTGTRSCASAKRGDFPVDTRITDGPTMYHPGDTPRHFSLALTNTTATRCADLHPLLVLVDDSRKLTPKHIRLEFRDAGRWRPATVERTDRDENIGVFDDFPGFSVGAGDTVTVDVRLAFTGATRPDRVTATAALVRRKDDDGDWVGESRAYPFAIDEEPAGPALAKKAEELARTGTRTSLGLAAASGSLLLAGAALVLVGRRLRTRTR
ncbi:hypothetical protein ACTWJ8_16240 [Streptomyces sp. SDT5-1]|uniref:hypothetical protein n=1 Tax=Streptomyces sp. SDT5-1 TaxID=3406418 RepID=UPI003FD39098